MVMVAIAVRANGPYKILPCNQFVYRLPQVQYRNVCDGKERNNPVYSIPWVYLRYSLLHSLTDDREEIRVMAPHETTLRSVAW